MNWVRNDRLVALYHHIKQAFVNSNGLHFVIKILKYIYLQF
jgi:hypothetical protein